MSLDGYIDDASGRRLLLSGEADLDRVDEVRAGCDAILVGAGTIRADDPRLALRSPARRDARAAAGLPPDPAKVTVTGTGDLDPAARFFTTGSSMRLVYAASGAVASLTRRLAGLAIVADAGEPVSLRDVLTDLARRQVRRLLVEGGASVQAQLLAAGLADELQLVVAPFFVGDPRAPRLAGGGAGPFPWDAGHPARLAEVRRVGNDALLRYALSGRFDPAG